MANRTHRAPADRAQGSSTLNRLRNRAEARENSLRLRAPVTFRPHGTRLALKLRGIRADNRNFPSLPLDRTGAPLKKSVFVEIVRLLAVLLFTGAGYLLGQQQDGPLFYTTLGAGIGYVIGGIGGRFLRGALGAVEAQSDHLSAGEILAGVVGALLVGALSALVALPAIGLLPGPWGWPIFALIVWMGVNAGFRIAWKKSSELLSMAGLSQLAPVDPNAAPTEDAVLVDTSVLIDGRLLRIARTGFLHRNLLVPGFVLHELQMLSDSTEPGIRRKGRLGLESLEAIRQDALLHVYVPEDEIPELEDVDAKLIALAIRLSVSLLTNDESLRQVAELRGVRCLSLHRLSKSLSWVRTPGDTVRLTILKEGQQDGQGVGYLPEGAMVVIADAAALIGEETDVLITGSAATSAGRIFFATLDKD
jgi:uncharacterized protein YacL